MNAFIFGYLLGSVVTAVILWKWAKAIERWRRARVDLRNYINGVRGQLDVLRNNGLTVVRLSMISLALLAGAVFVLYQVATGGL